MTYLTYQQSKATEYDEDIDISRRSREYDDVIQQKHEIRHLQERLKVLRDERRDDEADALNDIIKDKVEWPNWTIRWNKYTIDGYFAGQHRN